MCLWQHWMPVALRSTNTYTLIYNFICITVIVQGEKQKASLVVGEQEKKEFFTLENIDLLWNKVIRTKFLLVSKTHLLLIFFMYSPFPSKTFKSEISPQPRTTQVVHCGFDINYNCYSAHILLIVNTLICVNKSFYITS